MNRSTYPNGESAGGYSSSGETLNNIDDQDLRRMSPSLRSSMKINVMRDLKSAQRLKQSSVIANRRLSDMYDHQWMTSATNRVNEAARSSYSPVKRTTSTSKPGDLTISGGEMTSSSEGIARNMYTMPRRYNYLLRKN